MKNSFWRISARAIAPMPRPIQGLTYEVLEIGDESKTPRSDRDTVAIRFVAKTVDGKVVESSYERGDTTRTALGDLMPGLRQSVRLVGEGGRMNVWIPSAWLTGPKATRNWAWSRTRRCSTRSNSSMSADFFFKRGLKNKIGCP